MHRFLRAIIKPVFHRLSTDLSTGCTRHCEEPTGPAFGQPDDKLRDEAIHSFFARRDGLLRGACHRARIRATRWLAMTDEATTPHQYASRSPGNNCPPTQHQSLSAAPG